MSGNGNDQAGMATSGPDGGLSSQSLADMLDRWGTDLAAWPDQRIAGQARRLIERDPASRRHWLDAKGLDGLLDAVPAPAPSSDLADRIVARATAVSPSVNVVSLAGHRGRRHLGWPSMALAASLLIGLVAGAGVSPETIDSWLGGTVYAADYLGLSPDGAGQ